MAIVIPSRPAETILTELHELRSAMASGALEVWFGDRKVRYQSITAMQSAESRLIEEYGQATGQVQTAVSFAKFTRD